MDSADLAVLGLIGNYGWGSFRPEAVIRNAWAINEIGREVRRARWLRPGICSHSGVNYHTRIGKERVAILRLMRLTIVGISDAHALEERVRYAPITRPFSPLSAQTSPPIMK